MSHHTHHDENEEARKEAAASEEPAGDREVNPADDPGPRGNPESDPDRVEKGLEDLERSGSN